MTMSMTRAEAEQRAQRNGHTLGPWRQREDGKADVAKCLNLDCTCGLIDLNDGTISGGALTHRHLPRTGSLVPANLGGWKMEEVSEDMLVVGDAEQRLHSLFHCIVSGIPHNSTYHGPFFSRSGLTARLDVKGYVYELTVKEQ